MKTPSPNTESLEGLSALYSGVLQNLSMAQAADNAIETKAIGVTALSLAGAALMTQLLDNWHLLAVIGLLFLGLSLLLALSCLGVKDYNGAAVKVEEHTEYLEKDGRSLLVQIIADAETSYTDASKKLEDKAKHFTWAVRLFVVGSVLCIVSLNFMIIKI